MAPKKTLHEPPELLAKCPTGIQGLDEITLGGLPRGRPTLVCGGPGSGKTLLGMEFLVRGATDFDEPGVFMSFEETAPELTKNVASLGFDLTDLEKKKKLALDHVFIERSQIEDTGEYDLEGLFIRLDYAINSIGAKRVVLDTVEALFAGLPNEMILRSELRRLLRWLKDRGVTVIITGERGQEGSLTRHGIEEYVSDAVIVLDHRVVGQTATRRLRFIKYRGSLHGANEYPFLINETGFSILPITALGLDYEVTSERVQSGIPRLDRMLTGGYFRGSSILVSGTAGTGKSSLAAYFADATCRRGERCLYLAFEESQAQIIRNMRSIGLDLAPWVDRGLLRFHAARPTLYGLEMHLAVTHKLVNEFQPTAVIIDPITNLTIGAGNEEVKSVLMRLVDFFKNRQITTLFANLTHPHEIEETSVGISSLMDTWLLVLCQESGGERNRSFQILKSRGMAHSNQVREFVISDKGIDLIDAYVGPGGVFTGAARLQQETREKAAARAVEADLERRRRALERKRQAAEAQVAVLRAEIIGEEEELRALLSQETDKLRLASQEREDLAVLRKVDTPASDKGA